MPSAGLFQLGMDLAACGSGDVSNEPGKPRSTTQTEEKNDNAIASAVVDNQLGHFIEKHGVTYAGAHLIVDLYDAQRLDDLPYIEGTLRHCVEVAGATLLHIHLHPFEPTGVSGVAVLAESHISVHTWPEAGYAAFDVFMCGDARPERCVDVLKAAFKPGNAEVSEILRGQKVVRVAA